MEMRHRAHKLERVLLVTSPALLRKSISLIARKSAGKIRARSWLVRAGHANLVTIVELWHSASGQNECVGQFKTGDCRALLAHEAAIIVPPEQRYQDVGIRIEIVFRQSLWHFIEIFAFGEGVTNRIKEWKVQQRIQTRVGAVTHLAALEIRSVYDVAIFDFTDDGELRILAFDSSCPLMPESVGHVLPRVHAYSVGAGDANPPQRILNQVLRNFSVVLIKIDNGRLVPRFPSRS